ncbi:MAG: hypothetical protein PCFJNLEI_03379 [Verrucomicrobiae bacterium]|nr:hypothetical protein [Verrucomicrobiae bacterium]
MKAIRRGTELAVRLNNVLEALDPVLTILASRGIKVFARSMLTDRRGCSLLLLTDDHQRARSVLETAGYICERNDVLWARYDNYHPGVVALLCQDLSQMKINLQRVYVSTLAGQGCVVVLLTSDNTAALQTITHNKLQHAA